MAPLCFIRLSEQVDEEIRKQIKNAQTVCLMYPDIFGNFSEFFQNLHYLKKKNLNDNEDN